LKANPKGLLTRDIAEKLGVTTKFATMKIDTLWKTGKVKKCKHKERVRSEKFGRVTLVNRWVAAGNVQEPRPKFTHVRGENEKVLDFLRKNGPSTTGELAEVSGVDICRISGRLWKMEKKGLVRRKGKRKVQNKPNITCPWVRQNVWEIISDEQ